MAIPVTFEEKVDYIKEMWFLTEPILFMTVCTHKVVILENESRFDIRCGAMKIELSKLKLQDKSVTHIEELMRVEILRILLKHPYQRLQPNLVKNLIASNMVVSSNLKFEVLKVKKASDYFGDETYDKQSLEYIYDKIELPEDSGNGEDGDGDGDGQGASKGTSSNGKMSRRSGRSGGESKGNGNNPYDDLCDSMDSAMAKTEQWAEDDYAVAEIDNVIDKAESTDSWGNLPGDIVDQIKASRIPKFNYKNVFKRFRGNLLSSKRCLTRMKPNRRFGFSAMGSKREFTTKLLIALDTSGSVTDEDLGNALGFVNGFFKYGIEAIDIVDFDTKCYDESLINIKKRRKEIKIHGRGGTDWNDVFRFMNEHHDYNGVIVFTDGYADKPKHDWYDKHFNRVLWCMNTKENYEHFKNAFGDMDTVKLVSYIEPGKRKK